MRRRYFVRVLAPFANFRAEHEIALEEDEYERVQGKGLVSVLHEEHDGKRVEVAQAAETPAASSSAREDFPVDTLTDDEKPKKKRG